MKRSTVDITGVQDLFNALGSREFKESLASRMAVEGGQLIRDEAKLIAYARKADRPWSAPTGLLSSAIYLAKSDQRTHGVVITYSVSWNSKKAPHGHLAEFGHNNYYKIIYNKKLGRWQTLAHGKGGGANPQLRPQGIKRVPGTPFLRPAIDGRGDDAVKVMLERARIEFPILLAESRAKQV